MPKTKSTSKKEARHQIEQKMAIALATLKTVLGDKEFDDRIKKAAKIFAKGFKAEATAPAASSSKPKKVVAEKEKTKAPVPASPKKAAKKATVAKKKS